MLKAEIRFGPWGGSTHQLDVPVKQTEPIYDGMTTTGYGKRLPTSYMIYYRKRWLRVRCTCYSNAGTLWATIDGKPTVVLVWDIP